MTKILSLFTSEAQLVKGLQRQDPRSQKYLYDKYAARFLAICQRYLSNTMEAEDVMIEGFMKIFEKIDQYKGDGSFEGWMKRLITNEALMQLRSNKQIWVSVDDNESQAIAADSTTWADTNIATEELMKVLSELPTGYRMVFNLYAIEGYSHAEIASMLNITESTSKSQLSRARVFLQDLLQKKELTHQHIGR